VFGVLGVFGGWCVVDESGLFESMQVISWQNYK